MTTNQNQPVYPIMGARELSQREIDLINRIKVHGEETKALLDAVRQLHLDEVESAAVSEPDAARYKEQLRLQSEGFRNRSLANDDLQLGLMRLVRAVDRRHSFC